MLKSQELFQEPDVDLERFPGLGVRHCQAFMTFLSLVIAYSLRVNFSVGIVAMTDTSTANPDFPINCSDDANSMEGDSNVSSCVGDSPQSELGLLDASYPAT
uniref:Uncharacterized protein n=1 Tax=Graphocephala atropunctata TaxID=36148 RepID=A0A1B6MH58_9HEMI